MTSERVNELSPAAELFYRRLMSVVDDFGRIENNPKILLAKCYPLQLGGHSPADVSQMTAECCHVTDNGALLTAYTVNGKNYLQINNFGQRERASKYPGPELGGQMTANDRESPQVAAYARATTPTPTPPATTHVPSEEKKLEVSLTRTDPATDPLTILDGCCEIYRAAGLPVPESQRDHILRLIIGVEPAKRRLRIPRYIGWALQTGRWPNPAKTKAFLALMQGTDWDVDVTPRTLPNAREQTPREAAIDAAMRRIREERDAAN